MLDKNNISFLYKSKKSVNNINVLGEFDKRY